MSPSTVTVHIDDCGEPLVDLAAQGLVVEPAYFRLGFSPDPVVRARAGIARRLLAAQAALPAGLRLKLWDGWRPRAVQRALYRDFRRQLRARHPGWADDALEAELHRFIAPPDRADGRVPPHLTGGAVDLTLIDGDGTELDLGTGFDDLTPQAHTAASDLAPAARRHRDWLVAAMQVAGFVNWPDEWWHWGCGDPLSARLAGLPRAVYGPIERWPGALSPSAPDHEGDPTA